MGLFDDFTNFMGEVQSLRNEVTQLGSDVVKELVSEADGIKQTVSDTSSAVKATGQDVSLVIQESTSLSPQSTDDVQQNS